MSGNEFVMSSHRSRSVSDINACRQQPMQAPLGSPRLALMMEDNMQQSQQQQQQQPTTPRSPRVMMETSPPTDKFLMQRAVIFDDSVGSSGVSTELMHHHHHMMYSPQSATMPQQPMSPPPVLHSPAAGMTPETPRTPRTNTVSTPRGTMSVEHHHHHMMLSPQQQQLQQQQQQQQQQAAAMMLASPPSTPSSSSSKKKARAGMCSSMTSLAVLGVVIMVNTALLLVLYMGAKDADEQIATLRNTIHQLQTTHQQSVSQVDAANREALATAMQSAKGQLSAVERQLAALKDTTQLHSSIVNLLFGVTEPSEAYRIRTGVSPFNPRGTTPDGEFCGIVDTSAGNFSTTPQYVVFVLPDAAAQPAPIADLPVVRLINENSSAISFRFCHKWGVGNSGLGHSVAWIGFEPLGRR